MNSPENKSTQSVDLIKNITIRSGWVCEVNVGKPDKRSIQRIRRAKMVEQTRWFLQRYWCYY